MSTRRHIIAALAALTGAASLSWRAFAAGIEPREAAAFIDALGRRTIVVLVSEQTTVQRERALRGLLRQGFDLGFLARLTVGRLWREMSAEQREEFQEAFEDWILRTSAARLTGFAGQRFTVSGAEPSGEDAMVRSEITGGGPPARVDWRVRATPQGPKIIDGVVEGVSMVVTHRTELHALVQRQGVAGLIGTLRARAERAAAQPS